MKKTIDLILQFPLEEYEYLTLAAEAKELSRNQFAVYHIIKGIKEVEDELDGKCEANHSSWEKICQKLGLEASNIR